MNIHLEREVLRQHAFGLVDATMVEHLPHGLGTEALVPALLTSSAHLMPKLIVLRTASDDKLNKLLECLHGARESGQPPPVAVLLKTPAETQEFVHHWNSLQLAAPQPNRKVWLRLHDPRVLHQLLRILTPMQRRKLFGRSEGLTYWIGDEWVSAPAKVGARQDNAAAEHAAVVPNAGPIQWDWNRIEQIGIVNRALHAAGVRQADALTRQGALAEQLIGRAKACHGLVDHADMVEFATRGLMTRLAFDEHPDVARAVKPSAPGEENCLSDRFALVGDHIWNELRQAL